MTGYLCHKYCDATTTLKYAEDNFKGQLDTAGQLATQAWTIEIEQAKSEQLTDLTVMDMYHSKISCGITHSNPLPSASSPAQGPVHAWSEFTLLVEEKQ